MSFGLLARPCLANSLASQHGGLTVQRFLGKRKGNGGRGHMFPRGDVRCISAHGVPGTLFHAPHLGLGPCKMPVKMEV